MAQSRTDPYRVQIWKAHLPSPPGDHNVLIVSRNVPELGSVVGALITHGTGPPSTHVQLDADCGVDDNSFVNITDLYTVRKQHLRGARPIGIVAIPTLDKVTGLLARYFVING